MPEMLYTLIKNHWQGGRELLVLSWVIFQNTSYAGIFGQDIERYPVPIRDQVYLSDKVSMRHRVCTEGTENMVNILNILRKT